LKLAKDPDQPPIDTIGLDALEAQSETFATRKQPIRVTFPDGSALDVQTWRDVAAELVCWLGKVHHLPPMPFRGGHRGRLYFLNSSPEHSNGPMRADGATKTIRCGDQTIYMDTHRSARNLIGRLCDVCRAVGIEPNLITVATRNKEK
jgi:hypothetical protein